MLEEHILSATTPASCSRTATFLSILLAVIPMAPGCAPKVAPVEEQTVRMLTKTDSYQFKFFGMRP
jgi:hypothetical protein